MNITREISMKIAAPAGCVAFLLLALSSDRVSAQAGGEIQVIGGLSTASFTTPQGRIQVHVSSDAAPGDTISGVVLAEPTGQTPQEQQANLGTLTGFVVELEGQQTKVSARRYEWTVPAALRVGRAILTLRGPDGRVVSQVPVPDRSPATTSARPWAGRCRAADRCPDRTTGHHPRSVGRHTSRQDGRRRRRHGQSPGLLSPTDRLSCDADTLRRSAHPFHRQRQHDGRHDSSHRRELERHEHTAVARVSVQR